MICRVMVVLFRFLYNMRRSPRSGAPFRLVGLAACFAIALFSCKFNPNIQGKGASYLQGEWEETSVPYGDLLLQSTGHRFRFTCDSVYAVLTTRSKVNQYSDSCFNNGSWKEYAKGTYTMRHDSLLIDATFTNSNFKQKLTGCYRIGQYLPVFVVEQHTDSLLVLRNVEQQQRATLHLKHALVCVPKPL